MSVTGIVHPNAVWANKGAQPGDVLVLTKPSLFLHAHLHSSVCEPPSPLIVTMRDASHIFIVRDAILSARTVGTGMLSTAMKRRMLTKLQAQQAIQVMSTLNRRATEQACQLGLHVHACTDVTVRSPPLLPYSSFFSIFLHVCRVGCLFVIVSVYMCACVSLCSLSLSLSLMQRVLRSCHCVPASFLLWEWR